MSQYPATEEGHASPTQDGAAALPMRQKVVLVMDLVESVRLMADDEDGVIRQIHQLLRLARDEITPRHRGRLVKSLGDGICAFRRT